MTDTTSNTVVEVPDVKSPLDFLQLSFANVERCEASFHAIDSWSPSDWAVACNYVKKLRRLDDGKQLANIPADRARIIESIEYELADMVIYADLLASRLGINLGEAVRAKFNVVSDRVGSPIKL